MLSRTRHLGLSTLKKKEENNNNNNNNKKKKKKKKRLLSYAAFGNIKNALFMAFKIVSK
jgi:hypothetical protein